MTAQPGWFLVGRHDGSVEPQWVYGVEHRSTINPFHNYVMLVEVSLAKALQGKSVDGYEDRWFWWEPVEIPSTVPASFQTDEEKG